MATEFEKGFDAALEMISGRLQNEELKHHIWWVIKREDKFPSQDFIADVIDDALFTNGYPNAEEKISEHKGKCCGQCLWDGMPDKCCCKTIKGENK